MKTAFLRSATLCALIVFGCTEANAQFTPGQVLTATQLNSALAAPSITGGSINGAAIGASVPSTGAFTTLSASGIATLHGVTMPATGQFYQNAGATMSRVRDRLFVGPAADNLGTNVASQPDWLTQYQLAKGRTYGYVQTSQFSVLNDTPATTDSLTTAVFGARTQNRTGGAQVIGATAMGVNNSTIGSGNAAAWAGYFEAFRDTSVSGNGGAYGIEIDTMNFTNATPVTDPYSQANDQTVAAQLASGGDFPGTLYPTTVGLNFQNNNTTFDKGIVFGSNAITGATGTSGTGIAIALGKGHELQWYGAAGAPTSAIVGLGTNTAGAVQQQFSDNLVQWMNGNSPLFGAAHTSGAVNYVLASNATAGNSPSFAAQGTDANVSMILAGKGASGVLIKGQTAGATVASGYVGEPVKNSATGVSITSGTATNITSITLTPGDWDVTGAVTFVPASGTAPTLMQCGTSTTPATLGGLGTQSFLNLSFPTNGSSQGFVAPRQQINVTATTTVYLVAVSTFTGGTMTANGSVFARRVD
ncbi:hypothetical protein [Paraburkholderia caledonica]|uniref:Uncharacterized protein n=1 Tax=Paraburkholderia caledonica TaxID=134536 RepID=A0ABU1L285_9BURK|nr:hypothetical protein [Paraburkholderia caledonica]MDR6377327.1 hypothetical protein [Paraburkholderia caledonica]